LLEIIRRDIHDGRLVELIRRMLQAGYLEDWRYVDTLSGTPQGGIITPQTILQKSPSYSI
jgi:retron-type reverse transcriptase